MRTRVAIIAISEPEKISAEALKNMLVNRGYQAAVFPCIPASTEEFSSCVFLNELLGMLSAEHLITAYPETKIIIFTDNPIEKYHPIKGVGFVAKGKSDSFEKIMEILKS